MSSFVIVQVQEELNIIFLLKLNKLCFSSGALVIYRVCLLAMTQRLNVDFKAEQTQLASSFRFWSLDHL